MRFIVVHNPYDTTAAFYVVRIDKDAEGETGTVMSAFFSREDAEREISQSTLT